MTRAVSAAIAIVVFAALPSFAQEAPALQPHRVTVNAGVMWSGTYDVGNATARLRGNGAGSSTAPFALFTADSRLSTAMAPEFRVGFAVTRRLAIEGGASFTRPRIGIAISGDAEAPAQELIGEKLDQYQIDGRVTWQLPMHAGRLAPFASIGAGYLRQLHEDRALAETGRIYYAGGGARYWLRGGRGTSTAVGVRADARVNVRQGGIDFENRMRTYPTVTLSMFIGL